jgi:hypothetical protein
MKKLLLFSLVILIGIYASAQKKTNLPPSLVNKPTLSTNATDLQDLPIILESPNPYLTSKPAKSLGTQIGDTYFDLQSNENIGNRMQVYPDGSISAVWTFSPNGTSGFPDRGTGYNHSADGGITWQAFPTSRIETPFKTGWPNIGKLPDGSEIVVNHKSLTSPAGNMCKTTDGGVNWNNTPISDETVGLCWPRMVTNGNTIHVIATTKTTVAYQGFINGALVYVRSTDGGINWTAPIIPTGLDTSNYATTGTFSDEYALACKGDTIAIVYGGNFRTTALIKSTNNGDSWAYSEILHLPIKKFDTEGTPMFDINSDGAADVLVSNDEVNYVTIDAQGKCHVLFGKMRYFDEGGANFSYYGLTDGLYYWNEDMGPINYQYKWEDYSGVQTYIAIPDTVNFPVIAEIVDINGNGTIDFPENGSNAPYGFYREASLSSFANAVIAPDGSISVFYSSIVDGSDGTVSTEHRAFRNLWRTSKKVGETSWSTPVRIAEDDFTEEMWPSVADRLTYSVSDNKYYAHLWYMADGYPGNSQQPTGTVHEVGNNLIFYLKVEVPTTLGIKENNVIKSAPVVYPNPASDYVDIKYNLSEATNITLSINNTMGQEIMTTNKKVPAGEVNISLNIETLPQGVYFIKSTIGHENYTSKIIKK